MATPSGAWYFGESIGEAQGAKRAAEQQYLNLSLANRQFDQQQQQRIDQQAQLRQQIDQQNYVQGLAQAQQRRANMLQAAQIRATQAQAQARLKNTFLQDQLQQQNALASQQAIQSRFDTGQANQDRRAVDAAKAAEGVRQQALGVRDRKFALGNILRDPNIRTVIELERATSGFGLSPEELDISMRTLAGRQRRASELVGKAKAIADNFNDRLPHLVSSARLIDEAAKQLMDSDQEASYFIQFDPLTKRFAPKQTMASQVGTDALSYFDRPSITGQGMRSIGPFPYFEQGANTPPPMEDEELVDPDDPGGFF